jgi:hypothetical protein|tara:strand:+ start:6994 stop:7473 length:480 start_codon:yes stop_codon:yes gene_type:complete
MKLPIKLLKLSNGDSLVSQIDMKENEDYVTLKAPVRISRWMSPGKEGAFENATFGPWESFSDDQIFHVSKNKIITLTEPRKDVKIYYSQLLERLSTEIPEKLRVQTLEEEIETEEERREMHLQRMHDMVDDLNATLGLNDTDKEDVLEYLYSKGKVTIH